MADKVEGGKALRTPGRVGSDLRHGLIVGLAIGLVVVIVIALLTVLGLTNYFAAQRAPRASILSTDRTQVPPPPRLQSAPSVDLQMLRAQKQTLLESYGWVDRQAGIVHIPIDQAMELLAKRQQGQKP